MTTHDLKTWPPYFEPVWDERKTFEIRYDDRAFQPGDVVVLREFDPHAECECLNKRHHNVENCARYTGRTITATIGHLTSSTPARGNQPGFSADKYVVFSLVDQVNNDGKLDELRRRHPDLPAHGTLGSPAPTPQGAPDSSDAPSPVSDESLPSQPERPAAPSGPSPKLVAASRRRRATAELLGRGNEHIPTSPPRLAFSSSSADGRREIDEALTDLAHTAPRRAGGRP